MLRPFNSTNLAKQSSTFISSKASNTLPIFPPGKVTRGSTDHSSIVFLESPESMSAFANASVSEEAPSQLLTGYNITRWLVIFISYREIFAVTEIISSDIPFFSEALERRGRGMNTVVSLVGDRCESKILVAELIKSNEEER